MKHQYAGDMRLAQPADGPSPPPPDDDTIDIRALLSTLWRGKWIVVVCTIIAGALGFLAVSQQEARYRATAKVMFDIQQANVVDLERVLIDQQFDDGRLADEMEVLRSTTLIERVIAELNLDRNPEFNPALRVPEPTIRDRLGEYVTLPPEVVELAMTVGLIQADGPAPDPVEAARRGPASRRPAAGRPNPMASSR